MKRRIFTIASALSLLLCLGFLGLWIRSCCVGDLFYYSMVIQQGPPLVIARHEISLHRGGIVYAWWRHTHHPRLTLADLPPQPLNCVIWRTLIRTKGQQPVRWFRFLHGRPTNAAPAIMIEVTTVVIPFWFPCLLTAIPPALWLRQTRRKHNRAKLGLCLHCGYDLRASQDRCPECGNPIPAPSVQGNP